MRGRELCAAVLLAGAALVEIASANTGSAAKTESAPAAPAPSRPTRAAPDSFSAVVQKLSPAVVNIVAQQAQGAAAATAVPSPVASPKNSALGDWLDKRRQETETGKSQSVGSGFLIDSHGLIVTNNHVVDRAENITVTLHNGSQLAAFVVGVDVKTDLALVKVDTKVPLPSVAWGDSDTADVGDWVVAIGNPYGLGGSVTAGIISARNRELNIGSYDDFIQTDAAINTGNSGGPLFNMQGDVIGVNSALMSPSGGSIGIGFAITSNLARSVIADLRKYGEVRRGWIGVRVQTVSSEIAQSLAMKEPKGALVAVVTPNGPAERAGILIGDLILRFDGKEIPDMRTLPRVIADAPIGKPVVLDVWRAGQLLKVKVEVERLAEGGQRQASVANPSVAKASQADVSRSDKLGLSLGPLNDDVRRRFSIPARVVGAAVLGVEPGSAASLGGIIPGDVLFQIASKTVSDPAQAVSLFSAGGLKPGTPVLIGLSRRGKVLFKALRL